MAGRDYGRFATALPAATVVQLRSDGFVVVDNFLGDSWATALRTELAWLAERKLMKPHTFQFGPAQFRKPHIFEMDLHNQQVREQLCEFAEFFEQQNLAAAINKHAPELALISGATAATIKLQLNTGGGGCFPHHYDNAGRPNKRQITCLIYLNPNWQSGDGGELELLPFLRPAVRIPPLMDRAVLFLSDRVLHRVLPSIASRMCFTIWIDGGNVNGDDVVGLSARHLRCVDDNGDDDANSEAGSRYTLQELCASPVQRAVSRSVYADEYETSLNECMRGAAGAAEMQAAHQAHLQQQLSHSALAPFIHELRRRKPPAEEVIVYTAVGHGGKEGSDHAVASTVDVGGVVADVRGDKEVLDQLGSTTLVAERQQQQQICVQCEKTAAAAAASYFRCAQCEVAVYCSRKCQQLHWKVHRDLCVKLQAHHVLQV